MIEEDNYDENLMTDDEMSELIGGYRSYDYSTEGEDEVTVIDYEKKKKYWGRELYSCQHSEYPKCKWFVFEWLGSVTNPKYKRNYQVGKQMIQNG